MQRTQLGGAGCLSCETHAVILPTVSGVEWKSTEPGQCVRLFLVARWCGSQPVIVITDNAEYVQCRPSAVFPIMPLPQRCMHFCISGMAKYSSETCRKVSVVTQEVSGVK